MDNTDSKVAPNVVRKLSVAPPKEELVQGYLEEIARAYGVEWPKRKDLGEAPDLLDGDDNDSDGADGGQLEPPHRRGRQGSQGARGTQQGDATAGCWRAA